MSTCDHDWQPIPIFGGRYKCAKCGVVGYRGVVTSTDAMYWDNDKRRRAIIPYVCKKKGCKNPAVGYRRHQLCWEHKEAA